MHEYARLPEKVAIFEVGPRDGLQNEPDFIDTDKKIRLVDLLSEAGCSRIEVTSFVHPKWVPQLRDAKEVFQAVQKREGVVYSALIPNMKGLELAHEAGLQEVVTIMSSSESHNRKNINKSVAESLREIEEIVGTASKWGMRVRSYIATAFGCSMEGEIPMTKVLDIAEQLELYGAYEISLGDTTGVAEPKQVYRLCRRALERLDRASVAVHFHQAEGIEFACTLAALQAGIRVFDSAAGGLGGCPYAPGARGNVATETLVEMFSRMGIETGIDRQKMNECGRFAKSLSAYCGT